MSDCDTDDDSVANTSSQESINIGESEPVSVKRNFSSDVYDFIANDPCDDKYRWFCLPCKAINKNQKWITQITSNFRKHHRSYHQDLYSESNPKQSKIRNFFTKSDNRSGGSQIKRRSLSTDFTLADKQHADSKLTDWIVNHSQ